jgi:hypothetical protein
MNWKPLLILPLSAWILGEAVDPPRLKPPLPASDPCPLYNSAKRAFLLAHAYRENDHELSKYYLNRAQAEAESCAPSAQALKERINQFKY